MLEAWLLADRRSIASFLRVPLSHFPMTPDALLHPKQALVNLARRSSNRQMIEDIVPPLGSLGIVGRGYTSRMSEFIRNSWQPLDASRNSPSLKRALAAIVAIRDG